ncbi:MAG TPA: serine hydrolase domain-containing protein [Mycobacteriales bacterium]|nr:serine hydrolase domain-containing protein [Mycobacteriales bacterium]
MALDPQHWQHRLTALVDEHDVVGASLAVGVGDATAVAAAGVLSRRTGHRATPESVFQIGSITKVWTATLVMQLVDEGLVALDEPVVTYLPDFRVANADTTRRVTPRHLLTHTSGIDGDFFPSTSRGDDCLQRYVAAMADLASNHPVGATMSYCNAGFSVLGRIVEVVRGATWDVVLRERLLAPLGLGSAGTLPEEALLWAAAVGHVKPPGSPAPAVAPQWALDRGAGPAGTIHATARDLVTFARLHLADGLAGDGARLLSAEAARVMRTPQADSPGNVSGGAIGLAWSLHRWDGTTVLGHDGGTIGQSAFLRVLPAADGHPAVTVALLTNGGDTADLAHDLFVEVFSEHAAMSVPARPEPLADPPPYDPAAYVGRYARGNMEYTVEDRADRLTLVARPTGVLATALGADKLESELLPYAAGVFLAQIPPVAGYLPAVFYGLPDGSRYLHLGGRATPRVS